MAGVGEADALDGEAELLAVQGVADPKHVLQVPGFEVQEHHPVNGRFLHRRRHARQLERVAHPEGHVRHTPVCHAGLTGRPRQARVG